MATDAPLSAAPVMVGLMSGTSLDGIAAAVVRFHPTPDGHRPELLAFESVAYTPEQRARLAAGMVQGSARDFCRLNVDLGHWLADAAALVMARAGLTGRDVAAVASHGQTLWHEPGHSTWQIGDAAVLAERLQARVIHDFRSRDVAANGQGAPLVPLADLHLFAAADGWRALQNLGGIGNVTVVPPRGSREPALAFDTGPGCGVIDRVVAALVPGRHYDENGLMAAAGTPVEAVLETLLADEWYALEPPKSTGREKYDAAYVADLVARCRAASDAVTDADIVATATALTARTMAIGYDRFVRAGLVDVVLSGGGARNAELVRQVRTALPLRTVRTFDELFFDGEAKEAVAFAYIGLQHLLGQPGNVPAATGADGPRVLGVRTLP
ncbi:MAG: anhydro-N-acetylmuramic acid kinase [Gemmatimonadaceae bacterium]|nr:anhydro-N-acetylmuramic acid kinase [Gemmatimonadaceae bacterium]